MSAMRVRDECGMSAQCVAVPCQVSVCCDFLLTLLLYLANEIIIYGRIFSHK